MAGAPVDEKRVSPLPPSSPSSPPPGRPRDPESAASSLAMDKDVAAGLVGDHAREIDPGVEAKVLRKIDWFLIPAMIVGGWFDSVYSSNRSSGGG